MVAVGNNFADAKILNCGLFFVGQLCKVGSKRRSDLESFLFHRKGSESYSKKRNKILNQEGLGCLGFLF